MHVSIIIGQSNKIIIIIINIMYCGLDYEQEVVVNCEIPPSVGLANITHTV